MLKFMKNLYDVTILRKNVCYIKNNVMYSKWAFPTAQSGKNITYAKSINEKKLKEILLETQNYKTIICSDMDNLEDIYPEVLKKSEKTIVYGLEQKKLFPQNNLLKIKTVQSKKDLLLWGKIASKIYFKYDVDFIYESFKTDIRKKYATYFLGYKDGKPIAVSQIIRGGGYSALYWVGVLPEYRKQGLGEEITRASLNYDISRGYHKFILTASEIGLIIYKKLGFKPTEVFYEYEIENNSQID